MHIFWGRCSLWKGGGSTWPLTPPALRRAAVDAPLAAAAPKIQRSARHGPGGGRGWVFVVKKEGNSHRDPNPRSTLLPRSKVATKMLDGTMVYLPTYIT